jgi:hypothetical protein
VQMSDHKLFFSVLPKNENEMSCHVKK